MLERRCDPKWNNLKVLCMVVVLSTALSSFYLFTSSSNNTVLPPGSVRVSERHKLPRSYSLAGGSPHQRSNGVDKQDTLYNANPSMNETPKHIVTTTSFTKRFVTSKHSSADSPGSPLSTPSSYVLAESYWEQQTSGCRNLQNLQCWANKYGMLVVEPVVEKSVLHTPFSNMKSTTLKFSDMFDMDSWNTESFKKGNSKLVPWDMFLQHAPRNLIVVQLKYIYNGDKHKSSSRYNLPEQRYLQGCPDMKNWPNERQMYTISKHKFNIVRRVCINFEYKDYLTLQSFHNVIFGEGGHDNVTVLFRQWRGLGPGRILVKEGGCSNNGIQENMQVSKRVLKDAEIYAHTYLSLSVQGNHIRTTNKPGYTAIMARLEKTKISFGKRKGIIPFCLRKILDYHAKVSRESSLSKTFLAIDVGKYGSHSFKSTGDSSNLEEEFHKFFKELYKDELSIPEWERTFQNVSRTSDPGYIALLQKVIATEADCLIFVGGGSFQKHALKLYQSSHPKKDWCIHLVKECTLEKNLPLT